MSSKYVVLDWALVRDKSLTMNEKLVLSEIKQLTQLERGCVASNQHFADLMGIKRQAASRIIVSLETKGIIKTEIVKGTRNMMRKIRCQQNVATCQQNVAEVATKCLESKENKTIIKQSIEEKPKKRFQKPTSEDIKKYLKETNNDNLIDADAFIDYYEAKDWMIGSNRMKNWEAAVRTWIRRETKQWSTQSNKSKVEQELITRLRGSKHEIKPFELKESQIAWEKLPPHKWDFKNDYEMNKAISEVI